SEVKAQEKQEEQPGSETPPTSAENQSANSLDNDSVEEEDATGILQPIIDGLSDLKKFDLYESILQILTTENRAFKSNISGVIDLLASVGVETEKFKAEHWTEFAEKIIKSVNTDAFDRLSSGIEGILHQTTDKKTKLSLWSSAIDSFLAELAH
ncbi:hypothetical protein, partial [Leptospira adleri]